MAADKGAVTMQIGEVAERTQLSSHLYVCRRGADPDFVGNRDLVAIIPMAALVAVMIVTVIGTVATENLAVGVTLGVLTAMVLLAQRVPPLRPSAQCHRQGEMRPPTTRWSGTVLGILE